MKIGVMLDTNVGPVGRKPPTRKEVTDFHQWFLDCGRMLDGTAVAGLFVPERHGRTDCFSPAPLDLLAALASVTREVDLGTYVIMPPLYPPAALLERLAVIDHLSGGRLICGVGAGFHPLYFEVHGRQMKGRGKALDHWLDLLEEGWSKGRVRLGGDEVYLVPPVQEPRPPIWIGGTSEKAVRRAARRADAFGIGFADRRVSGLIETYRQECERVDREGHLVLIQSTWVRNEVDARAEMIEELGETLGPEMGLYQQHGQLHASGEVTADRMLPYMYVGDSEEVIQHIRDDAQRWGIDYVILRVHIGIPPKRAVAECLQLIAEEVAPALSA